MTIERMVTVNVEAAHSDENGRLHGHSYLIECWTFTDVDLPDFERAVRQVADHADHTVLESSVGSPTMEAMGLWFLKWNYGATDIRLSRVIVRRPTLNYAVEVKF